MPLGGIASGNFVFLLRVLALSLRTLALDLPVLLGFVQVKLGFSMKSKLVLQNPSC